MENLLTVDKDAESIKISNRNDAIESFFEKYSAHFCSEKLWAFYKASVLYDEMVSTGSGGQNLVFYEDLVHVLQHFRQNQQLPIHCELSFKEESLVSLDGIITLIKQAMPVGVIYNLSRCKDELDLMIVLEKGCNSPHQDFENIIPLITLGYGKGTCTIHNRGFVQHLMSKGHLFYNAVCTENNVIYKKNDEELFVTLNLNLIETAKTDADNLFKAGMDKVAHFYASAQRFIKDEIYDMAMFMLQQSCELTYRCLLNVLRGKDVKCHSPAVLRKHVKRFAPEIIGTFSKDDEEEIEYLDVLEDAYVRARYDRNYTIDYALIQFLNTCIGQLQQKAKYLFTHKMEVLLDKINHNQVRLLEIESNDLMIS